MGKQTATIGMTGAQLISVLNGNDNELYAKGYSNGINVKDYGATGDGSTDDTIAIQSAIDATPAGNIVYFPYGVYMIKSTGENVLGDNGGLFITKAVTLQFDKNTTLKNIVGAKEWSQLITISSNALGVEIYGASFLGDWSRRTYDVSSHNRAISCLNSSNVYIHDCKFDDFAGDCISAYRTSGESRNIIIERCDFTNFRRWGVFFDVNEKAIARDCNFHDINSDLSYSGAFDVEYQGVITEGAVMTNILIDKCIIKNASNPLGDGGLVASVYTGAYIDNLVISNCYYYNVTRCININGVHDYKFINNHFENNDISISIHGNSGTKNHGIISNNTFKTKGEIRVPTGSSGWQYTRNHAVIISHNTFYDYSETAIVGSASLNQGTSLLFNTFINCAGYWNIPRSSNTEMLVFGNRSITALGAVTSLDSSGNLNTIVDKSRSKGVTAGNPTQGLYEIGEWLVNSDAIAAGYMGIVCVTAGTMSTISGTCTADGTNVLTAVDFQPLDSIFEAKVSIGDYVSVNSGAKVKITDVSDVNHTITVSENIGAGTNLTLVNVSATFKKWGAIEP